jgi:hypothetical protein
MAGEMTMITEPSEADRERIRQAIWIKSIKTFNVEDGVGTLA